MIQHKALLFSLSFKLGRRAEQDRETTAEVLISKNAQAGAVSVSKKFFPAEAFKELTKLGGHWKRDTDKLTLPWDDANRLCPASAHEKVRALCEDYAPEWNLLKRAFLENGYPGYAASAPERLGDLYDVAEFPSLAEMTADMAAKFTFLPIGASDSIRLPGLSEEQQAAIRAEAEEEMGHRVAAAHAESFRRLIDPVTRFVERLTQPNAVITQPTIDAIREIVGLTAAVNLQDNELESFRREVEARLVQWDAAVVRGNPRLRQELAQSGREMLARLDGKRKLALSVVVTPPVATPETVAA